MSLFGLPPLYWSYNCRYHGTLCERSFAGPSEGTLSSNTDAVVRLVQTDAKKEIQGFELSPRKGWFQPARVDVAVRWKDQHTVVIDSLPVPNLEAVSLFSSPHDRVAIVSHSSEVTILSAYKRVTAQIIFYDISASLAKREFDIECVEESHRKLVLDALNIAYDKSAKNIVFDIRSSCKFVSVNGRRAFELRQPDAGEYKYFANRGDTIYLELDSNFHAAKIISLGEIKSEQERKEREAKLEVDLADCLGSLNKKLGDVPRIEICSVYSAGAGSSGYYTNRVYEGAPGKFTLVQEFRCPLSFEEVDAQGAFAVISCWATHRDYKNPADSWSSYRVNVFGIGWGVPLEFSVRCECTELDARDFTLNASEKEVLFELLTTAEKITVQDRPIEVKRNAELSPKEKSIAKMRIKYGSDYRFVHHEIATRIQ